MRHPIPNAALDDRLGFLGTSGSGKTYGAGTAVELLLHNHKARVVIIDPLGVWWGLRLLADGKKESGWNVAIFGGEHGDLPLTEHAGALIGETAATMAESCIIDLSKLPSRAAERRFMTAFLETIYRKAGGEPFHLIVDEADLFAPQKPQSGDETLLGHMENIVRRGRVRGFIPWLISQRPAVVNKNVLSQVDGLIAFRLTASQDRDALDAWIEGQADKAQGKAIKDALPTHQTGEAVVWLPGHGILETRKFPEKVSFDSSRKPKRGEKVKHRALKPLDVGRLKEQLAAVVEEAKASDPKALRAEIAALKAERDKLKSAVPAKPVVDQDAIAKAEERGYVRGVKEMLTTFSKFKDNIEGHSARLGKAFDVWETAREEALRSVEELQITAAKRIGTAPSRPPVTPPPPQSLKPRAIPPVAPNGTAILTAGARKMLVVLDTNPPVHRTWTQVASLAGLKARGGSYNTAKKALRESGLITESGLIGDNGGLVQIVTPSAQATSGNLAPADMVEMWAKNLSGGAPRILRHLFSIGGSATTLEVAEALSLQPRGGSWNTAWKELRDNDILTVSGGQAALTELFQP